MVINKGLLIRNHVGMINACKDSDFVYGIFFVFVAHLTNFCFFKGINLVICQSLYLVDTTVSTITEFAFYFKVFKNGTSRFFDNRRWH